MAIGSLDELLIEIKADNKQLLDSVSKSKKATKDLANDATKSGGRLASAFNGMTSAVMRFAGPAAIGAAATALGGFVKGALDAADKINDVSSLLGLSAEAYQELAYAAKLGGVEVSTFNNSLRYMIRISGEVAQGNETAAKAFADVGISVSELKRLSPEQTLGRIADSLSKVEDVQVRNARASKLFGAEGQAMVNMLKGGSAEINKLRTEAQELGLVLSNDLVENAAKLNDQWDIASDAIRLQFTAALVELAPHLLTIVQGISDGVVGLRDFADAIGILDKQTNLGSLSGDLRRAKEELADLQKRREEWSYKWYNTDAVDEAIRDELDRDIKHKQGLILMLEADIKKHQKERQKTGAPAGEAPTLDDTNPLQTLLNDLKRSNPGLSKEGRDFIDASELENSAMAAERMAMEAIQENANGMEEVIAKSTEGMASSFDKLFESNKTSSQLMFEQWADIAEQMDHVWGGAIDGASDALTDFVLDGKADFDDFAKSIIKNLIKIQIQKALAGVLGSSTGAATGSTGGGIWGALGGLIMGGGIGGGLAGGGAVQPGTAYPVGERGPEIFVPHTAGKIVPNYAMNSAPSQQVRVEIVNKGTPQKVTQSSASQSPKDMVVSIFLDDIQRGGAMSKGMQSAFGLQRGAR